MRLRSRDITLAKSTKYLSSMTRQGGRSNSGGRSNTGGAFEPESRKSASSMINYATMRLEKLGYKLRRKNGSKSWKYKRMSTTLRKTIWLGTTWDDKTPEHQAATLMHELVHANQSRAYGFKRWLSYYIASARFRFAMETQAYRESCRAYRVMGRSERSIKEYAGRMPKKFNRSYVIPGWRLRKDVRKHMPGIVVLP